MNASPENTQNGKTSLEFEEHSVALAKEYVLDVHDLRDTYRDKPESLSALYNAMSSAKTHRTYAVVLGVTGLAMATRNFLLASGLMAAAGGFGAMEHRRLNEVGQTVRDEMKRKNRSNTDGMSHG